MVFFLSLSGAADQSAFLDRAREAVRSRPAHTATWLEPALAGLAHAVAGGSFEPDRTTAASGRRFLGWADGGHWMLARAPGTTDDR